MVHPGYPVRALGRDWRVSYRRRGRRLVALAFLVPALWALAAWVIVGPRL